jgi:nucleoside-diphosphate-sugar epimerase
LSRERRLALVTGASGFIGSHLTAALVDRGYHVRCLLRRSSDPRFIDGLPVDRAYADLGTEDDGLREACRGVDVVCHCAALTRGLDEETFMRVNTRGTQMLAETCLDMNPYLSRFLYVSSFAAAGPAQATDDLLDESCTPRPITWYGRSKLAAERALQATAHSASMNDEKRLRLTIVRPAAVFGPRDRDFRMYFTLAKWGLGLGLSHGERRASYSYIYVHDLISLILLALDAETAEGQTYFACDGTATLEELSAAIAIAMNRRSPVFLTLPEAVLTPIGLWAKVEARLTGRPPLLNDQRVLDLREPYWLCSGEKAKRELGFVPQYDLETGVRETVDWYQENGWL